MKPAGYSEHSILKTLIFCFLTLAFAVNVDAQCPSIDPMIPYVCGPVIHNNCAAYPKDGIVMENSQNINYDFNTYNQYIGGITYSGATILHIKMDSASNTALCKWKLVMYIDNGGGATPVTEWENLATYGIVHSPVRPTISLLQVRVYNGCSTPECEQWQTFSVPVTYPNGQDGIAIDIISSALLIPATSPCGTENVNGVGSYFNNYNDYTFNIDYRVVPNVTYTPGIYQLTVHFCLVEDD
jgi:hypothetical protein